MGLHLNASKCEIIAHQGSTVTDELLRSFVRADVCNTSLLAAPLFHGAEFDKSWSGRCDDLTRAVERISEIGCQDASDLRYSFSAPKVLHLLSCAPSVSHSALQTFDTLLKDSIQRMTNLNLSDVPWLQASLPVRDGGAMCVFTCNSCLFGISCKHSPSRQTFFQAVPALMILTSKLT